MDAPDFQYDVAFSFLAQDEPLALELDSILSERLTTFIYSDRQTEIAGTDGEETFSRVFGTEARIVAVLYRAGWGDTSWTRIEQTAIRNRAYEQGYDFVVFIPLDTSPLPTWLPRTQIWIGLERWGVEGAAAVIEARVAQAGGAPRVEDALARAKRLSREAQARAEREAFLHSQAGVDAANAELKSLFSEFERLGREVSAQNSQMQIRTEVRHREVILRCDGFTMTVAWSLQWANSLQHSSLYAKLWEGARDWAGPMNELSSSDFDFDRLASGTVGWRAAGEGNRFYRTPELADWAVGRLMDTVSRDADEGR